MAKKRNTADRWYHPDYKKGYVMNRNGVAVMRIGQLMESTGFAFKEENRQKVVTNYLGPFIEAYLHPEKFSERGSSKENNFSLQDKRPKFILDALKEFNKDFYNDLTISTYQQYRSTFKKYLTKNLALRNIIEVDGHTQEVPNHTEIRDMIRENMKELGHAPNTQRKSLSKLKIFFEFCIDNEWISQNPITKKMVPDEEVNRPFWLPEHEFFAICEDVLRRGTIKGQSNKTAEKELLVSYYELCYRGALRASEALSVRNRDDYGEYLKIFGKRKRKGKQVIRYFPYELVPIVGDIVRKARKLSPHQAPGAQIFPWASTENPRYHFRESAKRLGLYERIDDEGEPFELTIHHLRDSASNWWEKVLGIPADICAMLAGHTVATRRKFYDQEPNAKEILNMYKIAHDTHTAPATKSNKKTQFATPNIFPISQKSA